ncbi:hypothetical protein F5876DRAFT_74041 [Lentinula aff. lateritia]|uniref:Uncharacterized protein n=1 Tax=Lentinula aff. lateritia TaxID=2804960 RepID=A0ACC1U9R3_9AGAR|nr:hypothetical protein F5876DRAFT_74041 [Lentinula aff. lateritia]
MSPTTQLENTLPDYSASAPPPGYSAVTDGEELLAATHTPLSSRPTGSYSRNWDRGIGIRVVLHELNEDVHNSFQILPSKSTPGTSSHTTEYATRVPHVTIQRAPEVWSASGLAPVEVQLFMPGRTFGLADEIPFHIQLTGTASLLSLLSASSKFRAPTPTLTNHVALIRQVSVEFEVAVLADDAFYLYTLRMIQRRS